jgi:hypothetical protein
MANRFWVTGGTGNWNDTSNWSATSGGASGASVPGSSDAALLDASSGAGTVTLDISPVIQTLNCSGFTGTLAFGTNTISLNSTGTIFTGSTTMTVTGTPLIICTNSSVSNRTISPQAVTEANSISFRVTAGTGVFAPTAAQSVRSLDFTDGVNPTGYAGPLSANAVTVFGDFKTSTGMTQTAGTGVITFAATTGTQSFTTNGITFDRPITKNGAGTLQLQDNLTMGSTRTFTLTAGTLDLVDKTLSTGLFSSSNSNVRSITFGTGNITVTGNSATIFNASTGTNLTTTGTQTVNAVYAGGTGTRRFDVAAIGEANSINFNFTAGTDLIDLRVTSGAYRNLNFTGFSGSLIINNSIACYGDLTFSAGMTINSTTSTLSFAKTSTQQVTTNGKTLDFSMLFNGSNGTVAFQDALTQGATRNFTIARGTVQLKNGVTSTVGNFVANSSSAKFLQSTTPGSQATLSQASGTVNVVDLTIQDINAVGGASWNAYTDFENTDAGNNDGWNFSLSPPYSTAELPVTLRSFTQPRRF